MDALILAVFDSQIRTLTTTVAISEIEQGWQPFLAFLLMLLQEEWSALIGLLFASRNLLLKIAHRSGRVIQWESRDAGFRPNVEGRAIPDYV